MIKLAYDSEWLKDIEKSISDNTEKFLKGDRSKYMTDLFIKAESIYVEDPFDAKRFFNYAYSLFYYFRYHPTKDSFKFNMLTKEWIHYLINNGYEEMAKELNFIYRDSLDMVYLAKNKNK
jgi:hypothetical protein